MRTSFSSSFGVPPREINRQIHFFIADLNVMYLSLQSASSRTLVFTFLKDRYVSMTAQAFMDGGRKAIKLTFDKK
ncbi:hypothetical protein J7E26_17295 [Bacillus sp. ISL-51]|uniref:hypothetical protein n=1 Tax=Pseudomonas sp. ISL-88 TaxID=2819169 RepID=UPI001BE784B6|nr:hypothetical protein [Pseudomonas sp. ISL-88]MBT2575657.1 hypothetical protein [Bacillus sp. ISL-51]MBT2634608.1 hypothetical protein [Bacillus sp. ISL-26]MBT2713947.1 hypothetical protein [Pseudomonas sp. ISL-88]